MLAEIYFNMKVFSSLQEEHGLTGDRTLSFISSSDPQPHQVSQTAVELYRSPMPTSGQTSSQVQSNIKVLMSSPEAGYPDQRFINKIERNQTERQHSPVLCWTNASPITSFTTSPGSTIHVLHQEEKSPGNLAMRVPACNQADRQAAEILNASSQASPAKIRRQAHCCWKACGKKFPSQKELAVHVNEEHVRFECPEIDFQCHWQGCPREGKGFNARYKMLIHIRTHTNEKPHMCVVCGKSFSRLENLKIHTRSHTGERPYSCTFPGCNKAYSNSSDRFKHIRTHQEQKPYKCKLPGCRKQYTDPSSLRKHVRIHKHTLDSSRMELHHSLNTDTQSSDLHMEVSSPSRDIAYYQDDLNVCELHDYINTVRFHLEQQGVANVNSQPIQAFHKACVNNCLPQNGKGYEGLPKAGCKQTLSDGERKFSGGFRNVLGALKFISQHQSVNSHAGIQEPCLCSTSREQSMNYIKLEPQSSIESPVSAHLDTNHELLWKKEYKVEENKNLSCSNEDLRKGNESTHCLSVLPTNDLSNMHSALFCNQKSNDCPQKTKMTSCPTSPVLPAADCSKSPKLEHWKKRKLFISEQELQDSLQSSPSPRLSRLQHSPTVLVPPIPLSKKGIPLPSSVPSNLSHLPQTTSIAPLNNRHSPLPNFHLSSIPPASLKQASPQAASTPSSQLSPSLPLSSSSLGHTEVPSFYSLQPNHPPLHPFCSDSHSHIPFFSHTITPPPFYTHSSSSLSLSESPMLPMPNSCHYNRTVDHYLGMSPAYLLPCRPAFNHIDFQPLPAKQAWQDHGFNCLPALMTSDDSLGSAVNFHHFTNGLRLVYQGLPLDLPSLYQSYTSRFPLYLGVNR